MLVKSLLLLVSVFVILQLVQSTPARESNFIEQENSCRSVCGLCDCDGFYCEDECICECNLTEDDNLQCIADMKHECDKNGLEYELLLQESAQARFLRDVKKNNLDFGKHFILLKSKRESEPVVGAVATEVKTVDDPLVGAAPASEVDPLVGNPIGRRVAGGKITGTKAAAAAAVIAPAKILVVLTERLADARSKWEANRGAQLPHIRTVTLPTVAPRRKLQFESRASINSNLYNILGITQAPDALPVQPEHTQ
ncbi:unnamed protein product [Diamesa hyperborea]